MLSLAIKSFQEPSSFKQFFPLHVHFALLGLTGDEAFCRDKLDGYYQDTRDCVAFYQCFKGTTYRRRCNRGQVFNDMLKSCDNPTNFPCRQRSLISPLNADKFTSSAISPKMELNIHQPTPDLLKRGMYLLKTRCSGLLFDINTRSASKMFLEFLNKK